MPLPEIFGQHFIYIYTYNVVQIYIIYVYILEHKKSTLLGPYYARDYAMLSRSPLQDTVSIAWRPSELYLLVLRVPCGVEC